MGRGDPLSALDRAAVGRQRHDRTLQGPRAMSQRRVVLDRLADYREDLGLVTVPGPLGVLDALELCPQVIRQFPAEVDPNRQDRRLAGRLSMPIADHYLLDDHLALD